MDVAIIKKETMRSRPGVYFFGGYGRTPNDETDNRAEFYDDVKIVYLAEPDGFAMDPGKISAP